MAKIVKETKTAPKSEVSEDVTGLLASFKAKYGRDTTAPLNVIQETFDGETEDRTETEWLEAIKSLEGEANKPAKPVHVTNALAATLAGKANGDAAFIGHVSEMVETAEKRKRLPAAIALDMSRIYSRDELASFPVPGSKLSDRKPGENTAYDIGKVGEPSWYQDYWSTLSIAKPVIEALESFNGQSGNAVKADKLMFQGRRSQAVQSVKNGVNILRQMEAFADKTDLTVRFRTEVKDGVKQIQRTTAPISIANAEGVATFHSVGTFLGFDVDKIAAAEDQLAACKVERAPRAAKGTVQVPSLGTVEQVMDAFSELKAALDDSKIRDALKEETNKAGSDTLILDIYEVSRRCDRWLSQPAVAKRLQELKEAEETNGNGKVKAAA